MKTQELGYFIYLAWESLSYFCKWWSMTRQFSSPIITIYVRMPLFLFCYCFPVYTLILKDIELDITMAKYGMVGWSRLEDSLTAYELSLFSITVHKQIFKSQLPKGIVSRDF